MPATVYTDISDLITAISNDIKTNGAAEITGQVHQDILLSTVLSLLNIVNQIPAETVGLFPEWDSGTTYAGGVQVVVQHDGALYLFVSASDDMGTEPGTNGAIWQPIDALTLAHFRNQDQYLDEGGPYQVSAQEIYEFLHAAPASSWLNTVTYSSNTPPGVIPPKRYLVLPGATGLWAGHDNAIAEGIDGTWVFTAATFGMAVIDASRPRGIWIFTGTWEYHLFASSPALAYTHSVIAPYPINGTYANHVISVELDIELDTVSLIGDCEYHVELVNTTGSSYNISYMAGKWLSDSAVGYPTSIDPGQTIFLTFKSISSGKALITLNANDQSDI